MPLGGTRPGRQRRPRAGGGGGQGVLSADQGLGQPQGLRRAEVRGVAEEEEEDTTAVMRDLLGTAGSSLGSAVATVDLGANDHVSCHFSPS